jgi:transposase
MPNGRCLRLLKDKGWKHEEVADFLDVSIASITNWLKAYRGGGVSALLQWGYKGKVSVLSLKEVEELQKRNKEKPFMTAKEAKKFIEERFGIQWHLHWVQKLLKKNFTVHSKR